MANVLNVKPLSSLVLAESSSQQFKQHHQFFAGRQRMHHRFLFNLVVIYSLQGFGTEASFLSDWLGVRRNSRRAPLGDLQGDFKSLTQDLVGLLIGSGAFSSAPVSPAASAPALAPETVVAAPSLTNHALQRESRTLLGIRREREQLGLLQMRSGIGSQHRRLTLNHLAKCGGSFARVVLQDVVKDVQIENEAAMVSGDDVRNNDFIIGLVRNPFDYYVSLWSFTSEPNSCCFKFALDEARRSELLSKSKVHGDTAEDRSRFKRWLQEISTDQLGVMSLRFYGSYLDPGKEKVIENDWHYKTARSYFQTHEDLKGHIQSELGRFDAEDGPVSCWVRTEILEQDLRRCLSRYEDTMGHSFVDFKALEAKLATASRNSAPRAPCDDFYDDELKQLVQQVDGELLRAFQYPSRCSE